jgi:hypothetical protein
VAGPALAASSKGGSKAAKKATRVTCSTSTSIAVANGASQVSPPVASGDEFGSASCGALGSGVQWDSFTVPTSGDTVAKYVLYLKAGTIRGTYDLTPQSGQLNFLSTDWDGTLKVLGGTGAYKGVTGTGTMKCGTGDGIHTSCRDRLKLKGLTAG